MINARTDRPGKTGLDEPRFINVLRIRVYDDPALTAADSDPLPVLDAAQKLNPVPILCDRQHVVVDYVGILVYIFI